MKQNEVKFVTALEMLEAESPLIDEADYDVYRMMKGYVADFLDIRVI